ncbi:hypothetical protein [Companilactobacillus ginsenosidimutans]|uniref:Lipoprotein n=1 Tax=Companilactobacillus ginsenosidimutans TaxID=1007676 RepID=A0A0H4QEZ5_9LACO|nr:hypothetical protein [Companilactobacillus ginsenosidimutans]AKP66507.1 hypothetical protein ABM34_02350 [Companilactobacillus ginsenosidimutans]
MKKIKYFLILLIPIFFMVLSGCSSLSVNTTKNEYSADGLVAVVKGKATKASKLTYSINGQKTKLKMNDGHFVFSIPMSSNNQDVKIVANNGKETSTKIVTIKAAKPIGDYTSFGQEYNYAAFVSGAPTDQIPLVAKDGIFKYKRPNGTTLYFNVQGTSLMGISVVGTFKQMKTKAGIKSFEGSIATLAALSGADSKSVLKNLNKQLKDAKDGNKTTMSQIESRGIKFNINLSSDAFYIYITK